MPSLNAGQVQRVWVQTNNGSYYRIEFIINGNFLVVVIYQSPTGTLRIIDSGSNDNNSNPNISNPAPSNSYIPLPNFSTNRNFLDADQFARRQMPQLLDATPTSVFYLFTPPLSTAYRITYQPQQSPNPLITILITSTPSGYTFQLLSPLSLQSSIFGTDSLCLRFQKGICVECTFRSYFNQYGRCDRVSDLCNTYDPLTGDCLTCYSGYGLFGGECVKTISDLVMPQGCASAVGRTCVQCERGYVAVGGSCIRQRVGCTQYNQDGRCVRCAIGFMVQDGVCLRM